MSCSASRSHSQPPELPACADLRAHYSDEEIVATIALFGYLNRWNDTMATTLETRAVEVANRAIGVVGWTAGKHGG